jgi:hypothetical protein
MQKRIKLFRKFAGGITNCNRYTKKIGDRKFAKMQLATVAILR